MTSQMEKVLGRGPIGPPGGGDTFVLRDGPAHALTECQIEFY